MATCEYSSSRCDGGNQRVAALDGRQLGLRIHRADLKPPVIARSGNVSLRADAIWERRLNVGSALQCRVETLRWVSTKFRVEAPRGITQLGNQNDHHYINKMRPWTDF
jgi:hypothetical protein